MAREGRGPPSWGHFLWGLWPLLCHVMHLGVPPGRAPSELHFLGRHWSLVPLHTLPLRHLKVQSRWRFSYFEFSPAPRPLHWQENKIPAEMLFPQPFGLQASAKVSLRKCPWPLREGPSVILYVTSSFMCLMALNTICESFDVLVPHCRFSLLEYLCEGRDFDSLLGRLGPLALWSWELLVTCRR